MIAQGVAESGAAGDHAVGVFLFAQPFGVAEEGAKGRSLQVIRSLEIRQVGEGGVDVDQFDHGFRSGAGFGESGGPNDKGNFRPYVEEGHLAPDEMIPQMVTMVGGEDNDGVFPKSVLFDRIENQPELGVDKADAGVIGLHVLFAQRMVFLAHLEPECLVSFRYGGLG